jgi:hypothetical protein
VAAPPDDDEPAVALARIGLCDRAQVVVFGYESGLVEAGEHEIGR